MATTDIFICLLLLTAVLLALVSFLVLRVIKVYVQEATNPVRFATPEEKRLRALELELEAAAKPAKPSLWLKIMSLKPIEQEKELVMEHTFDGIEELDNPTPAWFMVLFYGSIVIAIGYLLNYHVFNYGKLQDEEYVVEMQQAEEAKTAMLMKPGNAANQINENNVTVSTDKAQLADAALLFKNACSPCHGEKAQGIVGPNLTDAYWLHGGTVKDIFKTIKYGVPDKGMIAWEKTMRPKQIAAMANYILSLQGSNPAGAKAPQGNKL
jgi:cytochrome c oxidase cbb3-type subunit 3